MTGMAKKVTTQYKISEQKPIVAKEAMTAYAAQKIAKPTKTVSIKTVEYQYKHFAKVMQKVDFTLADWAALLCISERTLLRYAKANSAFNGLQVERILLLEKMIDAGVALFGNNLAQWLKQPSFKYNGDTPFSKLFSHDGVINVTRYIGQLEWGIFA